MNLVAFDTSTEACSVAVSVNGVVSVDHRIVRQQHAALLLPMLEALLAAAGITATDINGVVFGQGPGSFTGVRIAAATAQGLAVGANCAVQGVSSLQALASAALRADAATRASAATPPRYVFAAIDARMDQIYAGTYRVSDALGEEKTATRLDAVAPEAVLAANTWAVPSAVNVNAADADTVLLCGTGAERYRDDLNSSWRGVLASEPPLQKNQFPHAADILALADTRSEGPWLEPQHAQPVYLRNKVALTEAERAST